VAVVAKSYAPPAHPAHRAIPHGRCQGTELRTGPADVHRLWKIGGGRSARAISLPSVPESKDVAA
jgi:hypothetical protein